MPDNNMEIEFTLKGLSDVLKGFKQIQEAAKKTAQATAGMGGGPGGGAGAGTGGGGAGTPGGGGGGGTPRGGGGRRPGPPRPPRYVSGPNQRRADYLRQYASALKDGNEAAERDIRMAIHRTDRQLERMKPKSFAQRFETFARSTRFGAAGVEPLIGRSMDLLGEGRLAAVAGPIGLLALAASEGAKALKALAESTSEQINSFSRLAHTTGGTPRETAALKLLSGPLGVDDMGGLAAAITAAQTGTPFGMMAANQIGTDIRSPLFGGSMDDAARLIKTAKKLASFPHTTAGDTAAQRLALQSNAQPLLSVRDMSDAVFKNLMSSANATMYSKAQIQTSSDFSAAVSEFHSATDKFASIFGTPAQKAFTETLRGGAHGINSVSDWLAQGGPQKAAERATSDPRNMMMGNPAFAAATPRAREAMQKAHDRHTAALEKHARALEKTNRLPVYPGTYGNAWRGEAIGSGMTGMALQRNLEKQGYQLGIF